MNPLHRYCRPVLAAVLLAFVAGCAESAPDGGADPDLAAAGEPTGEQSDCGISPDGVQIERGIGVLQVGAGVAQIRARCQVVHDTVVIRSEGMPGRELAVVISGDTVVAEVEQDSVWRVRLTTERFRTRDSLGAGTRAGELTKRDGARALIGEGEVYVTIEEACGVSFRVAGADFGLVAGAPSPEAAVRLVPDTARVDLVLLTPCMTGAG